MNKRLISLLLVVMLVFTLLPMTVLADDNDVGTVKVMVFGKAISNALYGENDLKTLPDMIKKNIQEAIAGEHLPACDIVLIADDGKEYPLEKGNGEFIESFDFKYNSAFEDSDSDLAALFKRMFGKLDNAKESMKTMLSDKLAESGLTKMMQDYYVTYKSDQIPEGKYKLKVKEIKGNGYKLWEPASGLVEEIEVEAGKTISAGYSKSYNSSDLAAEDRTTSKLLEEAQNIVNEINKPHIWNGFKGSSIKVPSITVSLNGVWLQREEPGFKFIKTDLADKPLPGAEFLMVDRNETVKIVKAMVALGKDTFTNAMKLVGTEGFTWEELNILDAFIKENADGTKTLGLNPEEAQDLVDTYWALVEASAKMPIKDFLNEELRVPAVLKATSDNDGIVNFTEDSNITLVWSIDALMKIAGVSNDWIQNLNKDNLDFDNDELKAVMEVIIPIVQAASAANIKITEDTGELAKGFINDWIYPVLQNDDIPRKLSATLKALGGEEDENELTWKDFIPNHAILTPKMPASDYILMEEKAPEGYMRNPIFYTIHLTWDTEQEDVSKWCYVTVADIGIIGPYLAENYYTFFRNNSFVSVSDKILNRVMGKDVNVLEWVLANEEGATAATLDYWAKLISANMAGDSENGSEEAVANELAQYVIKHGDNVQSLMHFAYTVANRRRAVISSEVNEEWHFYNFNDSIHTSYATRITALLEGAKASIKNDTLVGQATKAVIQAQIDTVAAVDKTITSITARYTAAVKEAVGKVADSVKSSATEAAKSVVSSLLKRLFK